MAHLQKMQEIDNLILALVEPKSGSRRQITGESQKNLLALRRASAR
jgi:hypothetical protein